MTDLQISKYVRAVLHFGNLRNVKLIDQTVELLHGNGITGEALLMMTSEKLMADGIYRGPAECLDKRIRELNGEVETRHLNMKFKTAFQCLAFFKQVKHVISRSL